MIFEAARPVGASNKTLRLAELPFQYKNCFATT